MYLGIEGELVAPDPIAGNAWVEDEGKPSLPGHMADAISRFSSSEGVRRTLSSEFQSAFSELKTQELLEFERRVTDFELETYLSI